MAKYTELFSEYLENGGSLPAVFEDILDFTDLFKGYYIDKEIGFETPNLFELKLKNRADIVVPPYVDRITEIENRKAELLAANKSHLKTGSTDFDNGQRINRTWDNPYNLGAPGPSNANVTTQDTAESYTNSERYNNILDSESGYTVDEGLRIYDFFDKEVHNIKLALLKEFENLFMQVY